MLLFSHIYLKNLVLREDNSLEQSVTNLATTIPDIRYFADGDWKSTHIDLDQAEKIFNDSPSFRKGYQMHISLDRWSLKSGFYDEFRKAQPFFLRPLLRKKIIDLIMEIYSLEKLKSDKITFSKEYSESVEKLGISKQDFEIFVGSIQKE